jgi:predicted nucleotidyltransferase
MASGEIPGPLLTQAFADLCERHGVKLAVLFGSLVTGKASRDSDIDLAVLLDTKNPPGFGEVPQRAPVRLLTDLLHFLGTSKLDLVILNRADALLRYEVARTGKPLYQSAPSVFAEFWTHE